MIDYSEYLEGYRDAEAYDVEEGGYDADYPLTEQKESCMEQFCNYAILEMADCV